MGIHVIHHRKPAGMPVNTSRGYCRLCWTPPGREHGLACPAVPHPDAVNTYRGLLVGLLLAIALDAVLLALLIGAAL